MVFGLSEELKIKVGTEKDCVQSVSVEWPAAKVKEQIEKAFSGVQSQAKLPGFRPGKSPMDLVRQQFKETAYARAQDDLMREGVSEAIKSKQIKAIQTPVIVSAQFDPEKSFQFEFQVEVAPQFKVGNYKGLKINQTIKVVSEDDVQKALNNIADMNARLNESKDESLTATQYAVVDYEGFLDDKLIEGAKAENFLIDMSAPQTITGLSDGLVGAKVGEEKAITVKFPEDSPSKDLAGKEAVFKVKLKAIKEKKVPVLDDEFAKDLGLASLDEMKSRVRANLEAELKRTLRQEIEKQIIDKLLEENKFSVPLSLIQEQEKHLVAKQKNLMARQGLPQAQQDKMIQELSAQTKTQAEKEVRLAYVMGAIAEEEKIEATEEEINIRITEILSKVEPKEKEQVENALKGTHSNQLRSELRESKLFDWILAHAKVKEISGG